MLLRQAIGFQSRCWSSLGIYWVSWERRSRRAVDVVDTELDGFMHGCNALLLHSGLTSCQ